MSVERKLGGSARYSNLNYCDLYWWLVTVQYAYRDRKNNPYVYLLKVIPVHMSRSRDFPSLLPGYRAKYDGIRKG